MKETNKRTLIYLGENTIKTLKFQALEQGISYSKLIREILDRHLQEGERP